MRPHHDRELTATVATDHLGYYGHVAPHILTACEVCGQTHRILSIRQRTRMWRLDCPHQQLHLYFPRNAHLHDAGYCHADFSTFLNVILNCFLNYDLHRVRL